MNQTQLMRALASRADLARMSEAQAAAEQVRELRLGIVDATKVRRAASAGGLIKAELRDLHSLDRAMNPAVADYERMTMEREMREAARVGAELRRGAQTLDLLGGGAIAPRSPGPTAAPAPRKSAPARSRPRPATAPALAKPRVARPHPTAVAVAQRQTHGARARVFFFLRAAGLNEEAEHLLAIEERVHAKGRPAQYHAALSTRLLLKGVADRCFSARPGLWRGLDDRNHPVGDSNVGNRLIAFLEGTVGRSFLRDDKEHRVLIAQIDALTRFGSRGPHRIYHPEEGERHLLRLLDVLDLVARAWALATAQPTATA